MYRKTFYGAAIFAFFCFATGAHAFLDWRPFTVRGELVLEKRKASVSITQEVLEKYLAGFGDHGRIAPSGEDKTEKKWNEFQYRSFRFQLSRYNDWKWSKDNARTKDEQGILDMIRTFSSQFEGSPNRDALETMGRIFTPEFDFGIEF